jgi:3-oxoadipate enol-lactonase
MPLLDVEGAKLNYQEQGTGETIVLTAAYNTPSKCWGALVPLLAEHFHVVTYDVRGFGDTEFDETRASLDDTSDDLHALIEFVGAPVMSLGHAFGGAVAANHAVRYPDDLRALIMVSAGGMFAGDPAASANMVPLSTKKDLDADTYAKLFSETYCGAGFGETPKQRELLDGMFHDAPSRDQMRLAFSILGSMNAENYWAKWTHPTLLIYGTQDRVTVPLNALDLARLPDSQLHWLRGAGHYSTWERPERITELIGEFETSL